MLYQPSNISPDEIYGTGTVDLASPLTVSWRVSGDSAMTDYKIDFYLNDSASTLKYSTGKVTLGTPFWGVTYTGAVQYFTVSIPSATLTSAGMQNNREYKMLITQWWSANDSVTQFTPSVFITRRVPTVTVATIDSPVTSNSYTFTATYSQAQGDAIKWVRWELADRAIVNGEDIFTVFYDSGPIYGTGQLQLDYDGFLSGNRYAVKCSVETENGIGATSGWQYVNVSYTLPSPTGQARACQIAGSPCTWISWDIDITADGYTIMRKDALSTRLVTIAKVDSTTGQIQDYSAQSGHTYTYYVFPTNLASYTTTPMVTETINVQYWGWAIVEAEVTDVDNEFSVLRSYIFKYGSGGVVEEAFSNNNSPQISQNFTRYPTRQGITANYLTGSVSGFIGTVTADKKYSDTITQSEALFALSTTTNPLFLVDPKGHFLRIHTSSPISLSINHKSNLMPQTMTVPWVEVGSTEGTHLILYPGGDFYPVDRIIVTTVNLNPKTGMLVWEVTDDYVGETSTLSLSNGDLIHDNAGPFTPASLSIDSDEQLIAEVGD